jgi:hypothetical protein
MEEPIKGNQQDVYPKQYLYHGKSNVKKAVLFHVAKNGECTKCFENKGNFFSDGLKVWQRIDGFGNDVE